MAASARLSTKTLKADCGCGCGGCDEKVIRRKRDFGSAAPFAEQALIGPINRRQAAIDIKAAIHAAHNGERMLEPEQTTVPFTARAYSLKVGLITTNSRTGRASQAVGSYLLPGDTTSFRHPVRSGIYQALTPGGGSNRGNLLRRIGGERISRRCPPGFEFGGRFANNSFSNCGRQLFALADEILDASRRSGGGNGRRRGAGAALAAPGILRGQTVGAGIYNDAPIAISRAANIPQMVKPVAKVRQDAIDATVARAASATSDFSRLVRADGIVMTPVSDIARIARQRNNPDITGGAYIVRAANPSNIGGEELKLLGAGITSIHYALPGGGEIVLDTKKKIGASRASALSRQLEQTRRNGDEYASALRELATNTPELNYSEKFPNIDNPNELVVIERNGVQRTVPRWAFHTYLSSDAVGRPKSEAAWTEVDRIATVGSTAEQGAKKGKIAKTAEGLGQASSFDRLTILNGLTGTDIGAGRKRYALSDGTNWTSQDTTGMGHLSVVVGNDINNALGVASVNSYIAGPAGKRSALVGSPGDIKGAKVNRQGTLADAASADLARIILADYLTNNQGRSPANVIPMSGAGPDVLSLSSARNLMGQIQSPDKAVAKEAKLDLPAYLKKDGSARWIKDMIVQREGDKAKVVAMYEDLLKKAEAFSWETYIDRLSIGGLTQVEKVHLETLRQLYAGRVERLASSKKMVLRVLGVTL